MISLDVARQGYSAARQLDAQRRAKCISEAELDRLLKKVLAGYEQLMGVESAAPPPPSGRGFAPVVHEGGRP